MKKITLLLFALALFKLNYAQTNLFFDDFESYTDFAITGVGSWTLTDVDMLPTYGFTGVTFPESGAAKSFQIFNSTTTTDPLTPSATSNWEGYNSVKGIVCFAAVPSMGQGNDDWLISPQISLAASGNTMSFWYKGCDANFSNEMFTVGVSTTDTAPGSFAIISANPESVPNNDITWRQFTADLSAYDGQDIFIGINCVSFDQFGFMVDDFSVDTSLSVSDFELNRFSYNYNNELKSLNLESSNMPMVNVEIYSILGKNVLSKPLSNTLESIDVSKFQDGVYLAKIFVDGGSKTIKFIKN
ncbi:choice-of-anchor J domain-containing protein [Winogradskyella sp.]|uniref:choice-of-anchor J domain-containing protein n=1 Tax=Winogradskyella sp. TaxID=1883156 RepID=UPI003BAA751B